MAIVLINDLLQIGIGSGWKSLDKVFPDYRIPIPEYISQGYKQNFRSASGEKQDQLSTMKTKAIIQYGKNAGT